MDMILIDDLMLCRLSKIGDPYGITALIYDSTLSLDDIHLGIHVMLVPEKESDTADKDTDDSEYNTEDDPLPELLLSCLYILEVCIISFILNGDVSRS